MSPRLDIVSHLQPLSHRCQLSFKHLYVLALGFEMRADVPV